MVDPRDGIIDFIKKEFIGPDSIHLQQNGEEFLTGDAPTTRYISGVLFEQEAKTEDDTSTSSSEEANESGDEGEPNAVDTDVDVEDEWLELSNTTKPSAISLSFVVGETDRIKVEVKAATYLPEKDPVLGQGYARHPISFCSPAVDLKYIKSHQGDLLSVHESDGKTDLQLGFYFRGPTADESLSLVTVSLINANILTKTKEKDFHDYRKCFFQTSFSVLNEGGFKPIPQRHKIYHDEDTDNNDLLYREVKAFAAGHGCSPLWDDRAPLITKIETSFIPKYVNKPIAPSSLPGIDLSMVNFSKGECKESTFAVLEALCQKYSEWIDQLETQTTIRQEYPAANRNITACRDCLERMKKGLDILRNNPIAFHAFQLMNEAMVTQQLHYKLPKLVWNSSGTLDVPPDYQMPLPYDDSTWYHKDQNIYGQWRPFQIAFILINILSTVDPNSQERQFVDLIWFPTGGGKTEAYLGLTAFTIFWERLTKKDANFGISVLMRYTLRLLTSQQYERATALICACEDIRFRSKGELGEKPISIGLFVGAATSPNTFETASKKYDDLINNYSAGNPFIVVKCPWCGAEMGPVHEHHGIRLRGYKRTKETKTKNTFSFQCDNPNCEFHQRKLPLSVIDEDIWQNPPTLLIGTVDKFAMLVFRHEFQRLFGFENGVKKGNPSLIIQDELHLISGPLGSMVAAYEVMIDELMRDCRFENPVTPKIIASTATISRAQEQCRNLFDVPNNSVKIFPPSGFSASDSFFAKEKSGSTGREYVGVFAPGAPSVSTASIRLYSALLEAPAFSVPLLQNGKDAYWTTIGYYNSLRELGKAVTWVSQDIPEYCAVIARRYIGKNEARRWSDLNFKELTSRQNSQQINENLHSLEIALPSSGAIDVCFATSMISVGLDVQRLGLMVVAGQPKTTAEYIQATSRVGRGSNPGLIFAVYNASKPRDKSIFESFQIFHSRFYSFVEPTSISVFSPQIRRQALPAILIGTAFLESTDEEASNPGLLLTSGKIEQAEGVIIKRILDLDPEEKEDAEKQMNSIIKTWEKIKYHSYSYKFNEMGDYSNFQTYSQTPLIYPKGSVVQEQWLISSNAVPTSMRDVDKECNVCIWNAD